MYNVNVKVLKLGKLVPIMTVDDRVIRLKSSGNGNYTGVIQSQTSKTNIKITTMYELSQRGGMFYALLLWLIGLLGIFCPRYSKRCPKMSYEADVELADGASLIIECQPFKIGEIALMLKSESMDMTDNVVNVWSMDTKAEKNYRRYKVISWIGRIVVLGMTLYFMI